MLNTRHNNFGISDGPSEKVSKNTTCSIEKETEADDLGGIKIEIKEEPIIDSEAGTCLDTPKFDCQEYNSNFCKNDNHNAAQDLAVEFIDKNFSMLEGINQHGGKAGSDKRVFNVEDLTDISTMIEVDDIFVDEGHRSENIDGKSNKIETPEERTFTSNRKHDNGALILHQIDDKILCSNVKLDKDDIKDSISSPELAVKNIKVKYFDEKVYYKLLDSPEELTVNLERVNLLKLQKSYGRVKSRSRRRIHFNCKSCSYRAKRKFDLITHIWENHKNFAAEKKIPPLDNIFPGQQPSSIWYKCTDCTYVSKKRIYFERHTFSHKQLHEVETFSCALCPFITRIKQNLIVHVNLHMEQSEAKIHKCSYCNFSSYYKYTVEHHVKRLHKRDEAEIFQCKKCSFQTVYRYALKYHQRIHSKSRQLYKCPLCPFQTVCARVLRTSHALLHKSDAETRVFVCAHCSFKAKTKSGLITHQLIHKRPDEVVMFKCGECPYQTKRRYCLRKHRQVHKAPEEFDMIPCDFCPYKGRTKDHMKAHIRNSHLSPDKITIYKCKDCPYQSKFSSTFKRHSSIHKRDAGITFHYCDGCKFKGKTEEELKAHVNRAHPPKGPKLYKCDQCGFQFSRISALNRHLLSHKYSRKMTPEGPIKANLFYCYNCPYFAKNKNGLKTHMSMHSNIFQHCSLCEFKSRYQSCITRHMKIRHHL